MASTKTYSTITYVDSAGTTVSVPLPTIQSISIPDSTTIPSKPTITGEYRNQYVVQNALKVNFVMWLENRTYGEISLQNSVVMDAFAYLKDSRTKFNLDVTSSNEEQRFLTDLVIENVSYSRDSDHFGRLVCTVNAIHVKLVDLEWRMASVVEIFGHEIFTSESEKNKTINLDFIPVKCDTEFSMDKGVFDSFVQSVEDISGWKNLPVSVHLRESIEGLSSSAYCLKLATPIDMSVGTRKYKCNAGFYSTYGKGDDEDAYTVTIGSLDVNVVKDSVTLEEDFPLSNYVDHDTLQLIAAGVLIGGATLLTGGLLAPAAITVLGALLLNDDPKSTAPNVYNFANTYKDLGFDVDKSFEYIAEREPLSDFLSDDTRLFSEDPSNVSSHVIYTNGMINTRKISKQYSFDVTYGSVKQPYRPDGGLKIDSFSLNTSDGIEVEASSHTDLWSDNYPIKVVPVTLGYMLQIYIFSNSLMADGRVMASDA